MIEYKSETLNQLAKDWLNGTLNYKPNVGPFQADAGDVRICFSIAYFTDKEKAIEAGKYSSEHYTYNGGMFHGARCGRDASFDFSFDGVVYYAVTH